VTVTLVKAMSARYSVMGKVTTPGIRVMDRKVSLYEAIIESGGVLKTGDKKKIALLRFNAQGGLSRQNVNLADIESGKVPMIYLSPGDQVFVPGKGFTIDTIFSTMEKVSFVRLLFGSPF
jgi:protein involved in polysaccharide export with SLBB domain